MKATNEWHRNRRSNVALAEAGDKLQTIFNNPSCCFSFFQDTWRLTPASYTYRSQRAANTHSKTRSVR
jgi:hypothetical protein